MVVFGQWIKQNVNTTASFRGLSVVNEKTIWASGTGGTVIRTVDAGKHWSVIQVPDADKLDFRDIEAFDANTAYILSIGNGESSRIYKTLDGGKTWVLQYKNTNEKAFFDAIACWDSKNCIAMSDPVNNHFVLINTTDGGVHWKLLNTDSMPAAKDGEAAFAASGSCLITQGKNNAYFVTGGNDARVFRSTDRGRSWNAFNTPMIKGTAASGIFSVAFYDDKNGVVVGGNYEKPDERTGNFALTHDGGKTWHSVAGPTGYRSSVVYTSKDSIYAVGSSGSDRSFDKGIWENLDRLSYNTVAAKGIDVIWAVGEKGMVANHPFLIKLFNAAPETKK